MPLLRLAPPLARRRVLPWLAGCTLAVFAACSGGDGGSGPTPPTAPDPTPPVPSGEVVSSVPQPIVGAAPTTVQLQPVQGGSSVSLSAGDRRTVPAGIYTVSAPLVTDARGHAFTSPQHGQQVTIGAGALVTLSISYTQRTGSLVVQLDGIALDRLPQPGTAGHVTLAVQALDSTGQPPRQLTLGDSLHGLWPGSYRVHAAPLTDTSGDGWRAADSLVTVSLTEAAQTVPLTLSYAVAPSVVRLLATGLPPEAAPLVDASRATGPFEAALGVAYADWPRGASAVTLRDIVRSGARWSAAPIAWAHRAGLDTTHTFDVRVVAARVVMEPSGLPPDVVPLARWTLTSDSASAMQAPRAPASPLLGSTASSPFDAPSASLGAARGGFGAVIGRLRVTLPEPTRDLVSVGAWRVQAEPVALDEVVWRASGGADGSPGRLVEVRDSLVVVPITYAVQPAAVRAIIAGVPAGASAAVRLEAVGGRMLPTPGVAATFAASEVRANLMPGTYRMVAPMVLDGAGERYRVTNDTVLFTVASGDTATVTMTYALSPAVVRVLVTGLPDELQGTPQLSLQSGSNPPVSVVAGAPVLNWPAGASTARMALLTSDGARWDAAPVSWTHTTGNDTTIVLTASLVSGRLTIAPSGLPTSGHGTLTWTLTAPGQPPRTGAGLTLDYVPVGSFSLQLNDVLADADRWRPVSLTAVAGTMSAYAQVWSTSYSRVTGHLQLSMTGLPAGSAPSVRVARPGLPVLTVTRDTLLRGLSVGTTTVTADTVTVSGTKYAGTPRTSTVSFAGAGETRTVQIAYAVDAAPPPPPAADGVVLEQVVLTQAVQSAAGSVPLVAGRPALLRVAVRAAVAGISGVDVRVRLYHGGALMKDTVLTRAGLVPTTRNDAVLGNTWNWQLPAALVQPGLTVVADADPASLITDGNRDDNTWPRAGGSGVIPQVRTLPTWRPVLVPLHFTVPDRTGNVTEANAEGTYLDLVRRTMPLGTVIPQVRDAFAIDDTLPGSNDGAGWVSVLSKLNTLRMTETTSNEQYYYGVLPIAYSSGIAGMGYVPGRASVGWDKAGSASYVAAHEWGHNFSLLHGPCGNPGSEDPAFPHAGGIIGAIGWDVSNNTLRPSSNWDLMGYCNIAQSWISDFFWTKALNHRAASGMVMSATQSLVISGRIDGGRVVLDPAFLGAVRPLSRSSSVSGTHLLRLLDENGVVLLERAITPERLDHSDALMIGESVPVSSAVADRVARIEVRDARNPLIAGEQRRSALVRDVVQGRLAMGRTTAAAVRRLSSNGDVEVDASRVRRVVVREASTQRVVGIFDKGRVPSAYARSEFELLASDGVRSWVLTP